MTTKDGVITEVGKTVKTVQDTDGTFHHFVNGSINGLDANFKVGDRVTITYRTGPSYGLWFATKSHNTCSERDVYRDSANIDALECLLDEEDYGFGDY
jgi:hypothetical protein